MLPFLPVAAGLFCIQLDFSLGLALPTIALDLGTVGGRQPRPARRTGVRRERLAS